MTHASVADRLDIQDLFARYAKALDDGDVDGIAGSFASEAELDSPIVGKFSGRDGIRQFAERYAKYRLEQGQARHFISNILVEMTGDDRAKAQAYLMCCITRDGKTEVIPPSVYYCELVREGGQWLFVRRVVAQDAPFVLRGI